MDRALSFNIITGEVKPNYPLNSTSRRFSAINDMKKSKENGLYDTQNISSKRRLGTSSDSKNFKYSYQGNEQSFGMNTVQSSNLSYNQGKVSLMNATKLNYNPINHSVEQPSTWQDSRKTGSLSKPTHIGRFNAPNYSTEFAERLKNNAANFHKGKGACSDLCRIEKSYGIQGMFRKFK